MSLRLRLTLVSIGATLIVALVLITTWKLSQQASHTRYVDASTAAKQVLWHKVVAAYFERLSPHTKAVSRDRTLIKKLSANDLPALQEIIRTTHNSLASVGAIDRLQLIDPEGNYLVAVPEGFSGKNGKRLVELAAQSGLVKQGVDYDDDGRLMAVLAFPVFSRGKIKGIAVYSKDLQVILDEFQDSDPSQVLIKNPAGQNILSGSDNGDTPFPEADFSEQRHGLQIVHNEAGYHVVVSIPIQNLQGETIASLQSAQEHTATYTTQAQLEQGSLLAVLCILLATSLGTYWYGKRSFRPLNQVVDTMHEIAEGDLSTCATTAADRRDETRLLTEGMCNMVKQLRTLISEILNASTQLTGASQELLDNSEVASGQNQEQLSKIQEVAVSLREMATTIQDIAKNSEGAAAAAQQAGNQVVRGADLVRQVGGSINGLKNQMDTAVAAATCLEQNGKDITGILDVIRDIADQTSLLALNASIEAARAGEHGRGFAVVADEVRSLANRTQQSTKEIHHLIETLKGGMEQVVQLMQAGHESTANTVAQVYDAEAALSEIKQAATEIVDLNVQIASAIEQQSVVTAGINQYVSDIEKGSQVANQQTLSLMQAGKNLDDLATNLTSRVEHFRL